MARVKKIMLTDAPTLKKEAKIKEAAKSLAHSESGCVVIVEDKKAVGIVTETDLVKCLVSKESSLKEPVSKIMTSPVITIPLDTTIYYANDYMNKKNFRRLPIVNENGELIGIITQRDLLNYFTEQRKKFVMTNLSKDLRGSYPV